MSRFPARLVRQIPNTLTSLRILLAFVFPLSTGNARWAVLVAALLTEYLDGAISRRFHFESQLGQLLDPIADKLFFASFVVTNLIEHHLNLPQIALLGIRDLTVLLGGALLMTQGRWYAFWQMKPRPLGKATTVLQYAAFFDLLVASRVNAALLVLTAIMGAASGVQYWVEFRRHLLQREKKKPAAAA